MSILFPPQNATLYVESGGRDAAGGLKVVRPLRLSARGQRPLSWYIDGVPLAPDATGDINWYPKAEGFYTVGVTDALGHMTQSRVRVVALTGNAPA